MGSPPVNETASNPSARPSRIAASTAGVESARARIGGEIVQ
ncbi:MAG: hypothetical protein RMK74_07430 [Myxococcales bacterium]|nr:hypothetical protein [Myxococcales bacterium]